MKQVTMLCLLLLLISVRAYSQQADPLSARQIVDQMISVYASSHSYVDQGVVKDNFSGPRLSWTTIKLFSTAFERPSRFRFEFTQDIGLAMERYVICQDDRSIRTLWTRNPPQTRYYKTLELAVSAAAGVSSTSSTLVPSLLLENQGGRVRLKSLTDLNLVKEEKVNGEAAYRIEGKDEANRSITIWISKANFLLLKLFEKTKFPDFHVERTMTYHPQVNVAVPPDKLAFNR